MTYTALTPMLGVEDVEKTFAFYRDALGFREVGRVHHEGRLQWMHLKCGGADLMFMRNDAPASPADLEARKCQIYYFYPDDVRRLHASLLEKSHAPSDMRVTFYHLREFEIEDPDGYQLWFGQETDETEIG